MAATSPVKRRSPLKQPAARPAEGGVRSSFPVRRMDYAFEDMPRYWCGNDPALTHYFTGLSLLFPEGESYFVRSVRALRNKVAANSQLDKDIGSFIGQEAMHSKEHHAFHVSARKFGLDPDSLEAFTGTALKFIEKRFSRKSNLLVTTGLEHFTAVYVVAMMESVNELMTDETVRNLWLWHSIEETEHKAVAFDMYEYLYGSGPLAYAQRVAVFVSSLALITVFSFTYTGILMARDGQLGNMRSWGNLAALAMKHYPVMIPKLLQYMRPGFHPDQTDERELVATTKRKIGLAS